MTWTRFKKLITVSTYVRDTSSTPEYGEPNYDPLFPTYKTLYKPGRYLFINKDIVR